MAKSKLDELIAAKIPLSISTAQQLNELTVNAALNSSKRFKELSSIRVPSFISSAQRLNKETAKIVSTSLNSDRWFKELAAIKTTRFMNTAQQLNELTVNAALNSSKRFKELSSIRVPSFISSAQRLNKETAKIVSTSLNSDRWFKELAAIKTTRFMNTAQQLNELTAKIISTSLSSTKWLKEHDAYNTFSKMDNNQLLKAIAHNITTIDLHRWVEHQIETNDNLGELFETFVEKSINIPLENIKKYDDLDSNNEINNTDTNIIDRFNNLPLLIKVIIIWFFYNVIFGAFTDYVKGKVLEEINSIESYLISLKNDKPISRLDIITENEDIAWSNLDRFRIIVSDNVKMREKPSMKSEVIEVIGKNIVVLVIAKEGRQWLYIQAISGNERINGWVNRSYTKRIK